MRGQMRGKSQLLQLQVHLASGTRVALASREIIVSPTLLRKLINVACLVVVVYRLTSANCQVLQYQANSFL